MMKRPTESETAIAIGLTVYARMVRLAHDASQLTTRREYYVTLQQLEEAFISVRDELRAKP